MTYKDLRVALDGPGGAGKSTVAKAVAARAGLVYVDTGALYRTVGLHVKSCGIGMYDTDAIVASLPSIDIDLTYEETELTGMAGTTTTVRIRDGRVTLLRTGAVNSQMIFEEGKQHTSLYATMFGDMSIDIQTSRLRHNITERGGVMEIRYTIAVEHTVTGRNCFKIRVRPKK